MITLHHLNASRSKRIGWLLEELGADYEVKRYKRDATTNLAPPELSKVHPLGKSPVIVDDDRPVAESGAITEYLLARYDPEHKLHPKADDPALAPYLEWLHAAEGTALLPGLFSFYLARFELLETPLGEYLGAEREKALDHLEAHLAENTWFAGETFTAADVMMSFVVEVADATGALTTRPAAQKWLERVRARPAYAKIAEELD